MKTPRHKLKAALIIHDGQICISAARLRINANKLSGILSGRLPLREDDVAKLEIYLGQSRKQLGIVPEDNGKETYAKRRNSE